MSANAARKMGPLVKITSPDFEARRFHATPADTAKGMFFNGVLDAVTKLVDADARAMCLAASGERKFVDFFNYPIATFLPLAFTAAELLAPKVGGHDEAFRKLGAQATWDFLGSGVGKTLLMLAGMDPDRLVAAVPSAFKTAVSYGERVTEFKGPGHAVVTMKRDFMPFPYHEGVLGAAVRATGGEEVTVQGRALGAMDAEYTIHWKRGGAA